ncbi:MAG: sigma-70 family RNA polymerase sigma factor [Anaerolineae bacterium]|nr:sigma-70 family RNA polymerase sigma factor [Anaerolineae bacterium]
MSVRLRVGLPSSSVAADLTEILSAIERGETAAADHLLPLVYDGLRDLAAAHLAREPSGQTLQATALVHEAYLKLVRPQHSAVAAEGLQQFDGRAHFFGAAAEAMRRILVDRARARKSAKRGGRRQRVELTPEVMFTEAASDDLVDLDEALQRLAEIDPQRAKIVTLRFFGELPNREIALALGLDERTVASHLCRALDDLERLLTQPDTQEETPHAHKP